MTIYLYHETVSSLGFGTLTQWSDLNDLPADIQGRSKIRLGCVVHTGPSVNQADAPVAFATPEKCEMQQFICSRGIVTTPVAP